MPWGCGRRLCGRGTLGQRSMGSPLGFVLGIGNLLAFGNLTDLENSCWNPREGTSFFWALSPLAWGESSFSRQGFQTKPRQILRIHLLQSGSGAELEAPSWPGDSKPRPPHPPPPTPRHRPKLGTLPCLPGQRQGLAGGGRLTFRRSGLDRGGAE